jgi:hypothetical protein
MSFISDFEVFPAKPPRFVPEIYPFVGFNFPLEFLPKPAISITTQYVHTMCSLKNPLLRFLPLQHLNLEKLHGIGLATGLPWTLAGFGYPLSVLHFSNLKPYFMLEALMGLPSQSVDPCSKLKPFRAYCSPAVCLLTSLKFQKELKKAKSPSSEALVLKQSSAFSKRCYVLPKALFSLRVVTSKVFHLKREPGSPASPLIQFF